VLIFYVPRLERLNARVLLNIEKALSRGEGEILDIPFDFLMLCDIYVTKFTELIAQNKGE